MRLLWTKWAGAHGDHAENQKAKHKLSGEMKKEQMDLALGELRELRALTQNAKPEIFERAERSEIEFVGGHSN